MAENYLEVTQEAGKALFARNISGEVVMLNLLRFRDVADYSANPELMPEKPISGAEAYQKYIDHTLPYLQESGGDLVFLGQGGRYLIGPQDERWDLAMLVRQKSLADFMAFSSNQEYLAGMAHRTAALEDSRLLPLVETKKQPHQLALAKHNRRDTNKDVIDIRSGSDSGDWWRNAIIV